MFINKNNAKIKILIAVVLVVLVSITLWLYYRESNNNKLSINEAQTTSATPTAQEDFSDGEERPQQDQNENEGEAVIIDNGGEITDVPDKSMWIVSSTGEITLYSPTKNQVIQNGTIISGESTLPSVSFRVIDNVSGVISMGEITVTNGKFSGSISLKTTATEGRIDVFGTTFDGSEFSAVEIPVRFKL